MLKPLWTRERQRQSSRGITSGLSQRMTPNATSLSDPRLMPERGWPPVTRAHFDALLGPTGALLVGHPESVAEKIVHMNGSLGGISRLTFQMIAAFDVYVFVTPEYNHGTSGALKNAIDFLFAEWSNKAAGFVSYGGASGARAVEHLRLNLAEVQMATVRNQVLLSLFTTGA